MIQINPMATRPPYLSNCLMAAVAILAMAGEGRATDRLATTVPTTAPASPSALIPDPSAPASDAPFSLVAGPGPTFGRVDPPLNPSGNAPWGPGRPGARERIRVDFLGTGRRSTDSVFFACASSTSMAERFGPLQVELRRSIDRLVLDEDGVQQFNVAFFGGGSVTALFADKLHFASPKEKARARWFISGQACAAGPAPAAAAVRMGLAQRPQLLYLVTDGFDRPTDGDAVADAVRLGDVDGKTRVDCIYLQGDAADRIVVDAMKRIASVGHGDFKTVLKRDL